MFYGRNMASRLLLMAAMSYGHSSQKRCILAIDDEKDFLSFLSTGLESEGYTVLTASTPEEAAKIYEERWQEIDAVLLDFLLPPTLGDLVFDELQRVNPGVRVVLLTGFEESVADKLREKGLQGYLRKPFRLVELAQKIRDVIDTPPASLVASP
jgi:DNA-binding response OmpR family regulator